MERGTVEQRNNRRSVEKAFEPLTPKLCFQLMAPHTLAPSILALTFTLVFTTVTFSGSVNLLLFAVLFVICTLMQAAANTLNDYFDYKKGTDSLENSSEDAFDAVLVYHRLNPKHVLVFAIAQLVIAAILGCYIVSLSGLTVLVIGIIGALVVVIYSAGKTPLSYLPIGEVAIGFTMGGLIPLACVYVLSGVLDSNNTCDIEKDIASKRHTLAVTLGREQAPMFYKLVLIVWMAVTLVLELCFYTPGVVMGILMICAAFPVLRALFANPLNQNSRDGAMAQIISLNIIFISFYCLAIAITPIVSFI